jgi:hypothetical protein
MKKTQKSKTATEMSNAELRSELSRVHSKILTEPDMSELIKSLSELANNYSHLMRTVNGILNTAKPLFDMAIKKMIKQEIEKKQKHGNT